MVSTYPPTKCGIARFAHDLGSALETIGQEVSVMQILTDEKEKSSEPKVIGGFDPIDPDQRQEAIENLNAFDAVILQHEFGLFGENAGESVLDLISDLQTALLVVLHTVPQDPSPEERKVMKGLAREASILAVPSNAARQALQRVFGIDRRIMVLPHGSNWDTAPGRTGPRRNLISWGLLGPGKGIERSIRAVAELSDLSPIYRIVGQTHPNVRRQSGEKYRASLERLASDLNVDVEFVDGYQSEDSLHRLVAESDVVLVPYDNRQQISSGVLVDALKAGRPVVATAFPHAEELLASGGGVVVEHENGMSSALRRLLTDDVGYRKALDRARIEGQNLSWNAVAERYRELLNRLTGATAVS